ncbi:NADH dehydrogenase [ubiquinone] 1 alpha subcomplex subunit 13 [Bacillus rossius redtenbacheri]|uniref:NADH dehydrogenase [ubiquinone] 1 alpha subcomplex subunit 13 n=1 Tax=Bacillus rossius redtenbacheri TaxID=93214 RepID=UPI002FDD6BA5
MEAATKYKQDMPPEGGYKSIRFTRLPAKQYFSGYSMFLGFFGVTAGAMYLYYMSYKKWFYEDLENKGGRLAMQPILLAERDREFLKQLRRNRDEEAKLMANVPGWEVGTYYGEPIYKTAAPDTLIDPHYDEYFAHAKPADSNKRKFFRLWI